VLAARLCAFRFRSLVQDGIQFTLIKCKMLAQHANLNMQYDEVK
jgi:hypothetical protein